MPRRGSGIAPLPHAHPRAPRRSPTADAPAGVGRAARQRALLATLQAEGYCSAGELSRRLAVSEMTIRRDVKDLAERALVRPVYGGVTLPADVLLAGTAFSERSGRAVAAKQAIAAAAARLVPPASTVVLDSGTTMLQLARALPRDEGITVVTASLPVMNELARREDVRLVGLGGTFHPETQAFAGPETLAAAATPRATLLFLAASAIREGRIYCGSYADAEIKRAFLAMAARVVVVADSAKFGHPGEMVMVAPTREVAAIVTDDGRRDLVAAHAGLPARCVTHVRVGAESGGAASGAAPSGERPTRGTGQGRNGS